MSYVYYKLICVKHDVHMYILILCLHIKCLNRYIGNRVSINIYCLYNKNNVGPVGGD